MTEMAMGASYVAQYALARVSTAWTTAGGVATIVAICALAYIVYQCFISPLSHLPGPLISKLTSLYLRGRELRANRAPTLLFLHRKYGPIVRVGPNEVSISDWRLYRSIYANKTITKEGRFYEPFSFLGQGNIFAATNPAMHASRRRLMSTPFSFQEVIRNEDMITERVEEFINRVLKASEPSNSTPVDVFHFCGLLSLEVICRMSFNYTFVEGEDTSTQLLEALEGSVLAMGILNPIFPFLRTASYRTKLPGPIGHSYQSFLKWESMTRDMLKSLESQGIDDDKIRRFVAAPLLGQQNQQLGRVYTFDEATEESMGLAVAGSGVTQHTMIYFLYALARPAGQKIQHKLREELRTVGSTFADVSNLPYLTAVLKETYRMYPVIMSTLPRILQEPLVTKDQRLTLPPGTVVGMQNYVHHRDLDLFPQPDTFVPERWLDNGDSKLTTDLKDMNSAITPFSVGTRSCLGQTLAKVELYLALSHIVRKLEFSLHKSMKDDDLKMLDFWAVFPKGGKLLLDVTPIKA